MRIGIWVVGAMAAILVPWPARAADFVGAESCRGCHVAAYEAWKKSPHARAHLTAGVAAQGGRCIQCHSRDVAQGGDPGVSCESCHGAGEYYSHRFVMKDPELARATGLLTPTKASCSVCHAATDSSGRAFDVQKAWESIDHWTAERQTRGGAKTGACPRPASGPLLGQAASQRSFLRRMLWKPRISAAEASSRR